MKLENILGSVFKFWNKKLFLWRNHTGCKILFLKCVYRGSLNAHWHTIKAAFKTDILIHRKKSLTWWGDPLNRQTHSGLCSQLIERERERSHEWLEIIKSELKQDPNNSQCDSCELWWVAGEFPEQSTRWSPSVLSPQTQRCHVSCQRSSALAYSIFLSLTSSTQSPSEEIRLTAQKKILPDTCLCVSAQRSVQEMKLPLWDTW